ncbi:MAG: LysM peptidoglycan-binding domain-containing protein [Acidimicrobiales bacterium]|jgi:LysM repeat protein|nr:LysM peptidoglycan-binding domain-containing protein [Acidimicrobiales bacterium]
MLFCRLSFLALLILGVSACGGTDEVQQESLVTTTFAELFPENQSTTTLPSLDIPGWEPREFPELEEKKAECLSQVAIEPVEAQEEGPQTVTVKSGDTLGVIAKRFETTVDDFMRANSMSDANKLKVGQTLIVPRKRSEEREFPDGPTVLMQDLACNINTGLAAYGPDLQPLGGSGKIEVYVSWPRIEGPRESPKVNGRVRGLVQAEIKSFLEEIIRNIEKSGYACRAFIDRCMWLQENYEVMLATDDYFSVRNNRRILFPNLVSDQSEIKTETFDLSTGEVIGIEDLFNPNSDWLIALSEIAITKLKNEQWTDERMFTGAGPQISNFSRFNLTKGGLLLSFAPFTVGGAGTNDMTITIPYSQLDAYLDITGPVAMLSRNSS